MHTQNRGVNDQVPGAAQILALLLLPLCFASIHTPCAFAAQHEHSAAESHSGSTADAIAAESSASPTAAASIQFWTCSMHPQIRQPGPGKCPICAMDLIPVKAGAPAEEESPRVVTLSPASASLLQVQTAPVRRAWAEAALNLVGKVDFDETRLATITARVSGRIDRMYVDYTGIRVNQGDHMVELYSPELLTAQAELRNAIQAAERLTSAASPSLQAGARATVKAAREKLRLWGLTEQQIDAAATSGTFSDHITLYAPMGGTVIAREGIEGMYVETGAVIYKIADLSHVWIKLDAYEKDLPWIRYGQKVIFTAEGLPGEVFEGIVSFVAPTLTEETRTVKVRVNVANPEGHLKPGMFVRATIHAKIGAQGAATEAELKGKFVCPMHPEVIKNTGGSCPLCGMNLVPVETLGLIPANAESEPPLIIPASAPLLTGRRAVVYVQPDPGTPRFEGREIALGPRAGDSYIVLAGLQENEFVVIRGNFQIDSALQIQAKPSMMNPDAVFATLREPVKITDPGAHEALDGINELLSSLLADHPAPKPAHFDALRQALAAMPADALPPEGKTVWKEWRMKIENTLASYSHTKDAKAKEEEAGELHRLHQLLNRLFATTDTPPVLTSANPLPEPWRQALLDYLALQDALAGDAAEKAKEALRALEEHLATAEAQTEPAQSIKKRLTETLTHAAAAENLPEIRKHFAPISDEFYTLLRHFAVPEAMELYLMECPMAIEGNKPGIWLQRTPDLRNPYYGAEMLRCGEVKAKLSTATPTTSPSGEPNHGTH